MTDDLPARPLTDDLVDRIAKEVAALVCEHVEAMYPAATEVVAWDSCRRSIQGVVRTSVAGAGRAAENGIADDWLKASAARRRDASRRRRAIETPDS